MQGWSQHFLSYLRGSADEQVTSRVDREFHKNKGHVNIQEPAWSLVWWKYHVIPVNTCSDEMDLVLCQKLYWTEASS